MQQKYIKVKNIKQETLSFTEDFQNKWKKVNTKCTTEQKQQSGGGSQYFQLKTKA